MIGISFIELLIIGITVLVLINPKEYPNLAKKSGYIYIKIKDGFNQLLREINIMDVDNK